MSNMINSQPRFGLEEEGGKVRIFDYATSRYIALDGHATFESVDGVWDKEKLVDLIKTQQPVYDALEEHAELSRDEAVEIQKQVVEDQRGDKVEQFEADFMADDTVSEEERRQQEEAQRRAEAERQAAEQAQRDEAARLAAEEEARRQQEQQAAEQAERHRQAAEAAARAQGQQQGEQPQS